MSSSSPAPQIATPEEVIAAYRQLANDLERVSLYGPGAIGSTVTICDWVIAKRAVPILVGSVAGHPQIKAGNTAATTEIVFWDEHLRLARTVNRWYRLGRPLAGGSSQ